MGSCETRIERSPDDLAAGFHPLRDRAEMSAEEPIRLDRRPSVEDFPRLLRQ